MNIIYIQADMVLKLFCWILLNIEYVRNIQLKSMQSYIE